MENTQEMGNQQVTLAELGWLAGIIDGEGYIGLRTEERKDHQYPTIGPELHICNTDEEIVLKANDIMKRMGVNGYIRASKGRPGVKDNYRVTVKRMSQTVKVIRPLLPYLTGQKQKRCELIVHFCDLRMRNEGIKNPNVGNGKRGAGRIKPYTEEEWAIYEQVGPMSRRGTSEAIRKAQHLNSEVWAIMKERENERETA